MRTYIKYIYIASMLLIGNTCLAEGFERKLSADTTKPADKLTPSTATEGPVRKSVFIVKGKPMSRQAYFDYIRCKEDRGHIIATSIFIGVGAAAIAGSIPMLLNEGVNFEAYTIGGIVLATIGGICIGGGIPLTIIACKKYKKQCSGQSMIIYPKVTGLSMTLNF